MNTHLVVAKMGNFTLWLDRFCNSMSPFLLNRKTLKARWSLMSSPSTLWQSRLLAEPMFLSFLSTKMQFSLKKSSGSASSSFLGVSASCCAKLNRDLLRRFSAGANSLLPLNKDILAIRIRRVNFTFYAGPSETTCDLINVRIKLDVNRLKRSVVGRRNKNI